MKRTPIQRKTPVKKINGKRKAANFQRAYGGGERAEWVKRQPCLICGHTPSENAHVPSRSGMSRKGDAEHVVPLCTWHHTGSFFASLHALGKSGFNDEHGIDLDHEAAVTDARWAQYVAAHQTKEAK